MGCHGGTNVLCARACSSLPGIVASGGADMSVQVGEFLFQDASTSTPVIMRLTVHLSFFFFGYRGGCRLLGIVNMMQCSKVKSDWLEPVLRHLVPLFMAC